MVPGFALAAPPEGARDPCEAPALRPPDTARRPNRHLAWQGRAHTCVWLIVARIEERGALGGFLARYPGYHVTGSTRRRARTRSQGLRGAGGAISLSRT